MVKVPSTMQPLGTAAPDFDLDATNRSGRVTLSDFDGAPALLVMFLCNHCPYVIHIREALAAFGREYQDRGLGIVAISANDAQAFPQDGPEAMAVEAREAGYVFPYLFDEAQSVAKAYGAACTPDFFLFDGDRRLAYRGQFDGSRPGNDVPLTGRDLRAACDAVLEGRPVPQDQLPSAGCNIKWKAGNEPPYFPV
jgi:peroxiredoxin